MENEPFQYTTTEFKETDIAFSPDLIANSSIEYRPFDNLGISLLTSYVDEQYIDKHFERRP